MVNTTKTPLSSLLPPLICGTATFNSQYNSDPYALPTTAIVHRALSLGVRAFDSSPYYGPAEELLGQALDTPFVLNNFPRHDYYLLTKVGRIGAAQFDYSASWVRRSVERSLQRLRTTYLDVVYCHDVEFVTPAEVLIAVRELRRIRDDTGSLKYVGISGYPVRILCELAEMVLRETGEALDIVMSYANFTLQNTTLRSEALLRLKSAGVEVVPNASPLGMGMLRRGGVPVGAQGDFHPAPEGLRDAVLAASNWCDARNEKLEVVALRFALETWIHEGSMVGSMGDPAAGILWKQATAAEVGDAKIGVSVIGVSTVEELDETMRVWRSIFDGLDTTATAFGRGSDDHDRSLEREKQVSELAHGIREILAPWIDFAWPSPAPDYKRIGQVEKEKDSSSL